MKFLKKIKTLAVEPQVPAEDAISGAPEDKAIDKWVENKGGTFGKQGGSGWSEGDTFWSYRTIVAKLKDGKLYVNTTKYSATTGKLVNRLKAVGRQHEMEVVEKDEKFFDTQMKQKFSNKKESMEHGNRSLVREARPSDTGPAKQKKYPPLRVVQKYLVKTK